MAICSPMMIMLACLECRNGKNLIKSALSCRHSLAGQTRIFPFWNSLINCVVQADRGLKRAADALSISPPLASSWNHYFRPSLDGLADADAKKGPSPLVAPSHGRQRESQS